MSTNSKLQEWQRFDSGGHPDYVDENSLDIHVAWCVWHEGVPLYRDALAIDAFRRMCVSEQAHNGTAANMINNASNNELYAVIESMNLYFHRPENGGYKMAYKHLNWVLDHEGKRADVLKLLDAGSFAEIRGIYETAQDHDPYHVHHLIQAIDDTTLRTMINSMR